MIVDELQIQERTVHRVLDELFHCAEQWTGHAPTTVAIKGLQNGIQAAVVNIIVSLREPYRARAVDFMVARYLAFWEKSAELGYIYRPRLILSGAYNLLSLGGSPVAVEAVLRSHVDSGGVLEAACIAEVRVGRDLRPSEIFALADGYTSRKLCPRDEDAEQMLIKLARKVLSADEVLQVEHKVAAYVKNQEGATSED